MTKSLQAWKNQVYNKTIDLDNKSYDCVDVSKSWISYLTDQPWVVSAGWGNAKDIYNIWSTKYLSKVPRGNAPKLGDIVCMDGTVGGGYGHTGVVVDISGNNITIYQQNTFTQQPVFTGVYNAYVSYIIGFLRPNVSFTVDIPTVLQPYQRVASYAASYRDAPSSSGTLLQTFVSGDIYDFKGFVHGQNVDGNDIWFVGKYTGGYVWSGAFDDRGTHDLPDLTTKPSLAQNQREVGSSVINYRRLPEILPDNVIKTFEPFSILDFDAWTHGALVDNSDVWFRGKYTQGWAHSGGFTNQTTNGLIEVKLDIVYGPAVYPPATTDPEVTKVYNKKHPLPNGYYPRDLVSVGGGQSLREEAAASLALMQSQTGTLIPQSGFRSQETQATLYENYLKQDSDADRYSARPRYSEHQTGLVMDFAPIDSAFDGSPAYMWLSANAYKYGWVLRYPAKKSITGYMVEPWHWRYIGVEAASDMRTRGILTLEEYYNVEGGDYIEEETQTYDVNFIVRFFNALVTFIKGFFNKNKE